MPQLHHVHHAAGDHGIPSMVIQLLFLGRYPLKKWEQWQLEKGYFIHQKDRFNCGPIACLKVMELCGIISVPDPQAFYEKNNVCKIVMSQWEMTLQYCDTNPMLMYKAK
jgi:hypothetical protein